MLLQGRTFNQSAGGMRKVSGIRPSEPTSLRAQVQRLQHIDPAHRAALQLPYPSVQVACMFKVETAKDLGRSSTWKAGIICKCCW